MTDPLADEIDEDLWNEASGRADAIRRFLKDNPGRASAGDIARLLLMRRVPWPFPQSAELWRYKVLGVIIPEFDDVIARDGDRSRTRPSIQLSRSRLDRHLWLGSP